MGNLTGEEILKRMEVLDEDRDSGTNVKKWVTWKQWSFTSMLCGWSVDMKVGAGVRKRK